VCEAEIQSEDGGLRAGLPEISIKLRCEQSPGRLSGLGKTGQDRRERVPVVIAG
jgi:hypothetical protein